MAFSPCCTVLWLSTLLLLLLLLNTTMHGIYSYTPATNYVSRVIYCCRYSVVTMYGTCNVISHVLFCTFTLLLSEACVLCPCLFIIHLLFSTTTTTTTSGSITTTSSGSSKDVLVLALNAYGDTSEGQWPASCYSCYSPSTITIVPIIEAGCIPSPVQTIWRD
jgi:hypothetical protein